MKYLFALFIVAAFVTTPRIEARQYHHGQDAALDEVRLELSDLKHELKSALVDFNLLDERVRKEAQKQHPSSTLSALEQRVSNLEKLLEKAASDLRSLNTSATQALNKIHTIEQALTTHDKRLSEIKELKGTLTSISKAIGSDTPSHTTYCVKAGDSLEKIARNHQTSVSALKTLNQLKNDRIIIGQELKISQ